MLTRTCAGRVALALVLGVLLAVPAVAQSFRGSILGTVVDNSGAVVPGANVTAKNSSTGVSRSTTSDAEGGFTISELPVGTYDLSVSHDGFQTAKVGNLVVEVSAERRRA